MLTIKFNLRSEEEFNLQIKRHSTLKRDEKHSTHFEHLKVAFIVCHSETNPEPSKYTDKMLKNQNTMRYKIAKKSKKKPNNEYLFLSITAEQDCLLKATATVEFEKGTPLYRSNSQSSKPTTS